MAQGIDFGAAAPAAAGGSTGIDFDPPAAAGPSPETDAAIAKAFQGHIDDAKEAAKGPDGTLKEFTYADALKAGWQQGIVGLEQRRALPDITVPPTESYGQHVTQMVAQMAGDAPYMLLGIGGGMAAGMAAGGPPGAAVGAGAGAFGLPTALRGVLMDSYAKGEYKTPGEFLQRASAILADTAKASAVGALTAATGGAAGPIAEGLGAPAALSALAGPAAATATMGGLPSALDGHIPAARDFADAALAIFGLTGVAKGVGKLADVYHQTGVSPTQVAIDAQSDATVKTDMASNQTVPTAYAAKIDQGFRKSFNVTIDNIHQLNDLGKLSDFSGATGAEVAPAEPGSLEEAQQNIRAKIAVGQDEQDAAQAQYKPPTKVLNNFDKFYSYVADNLAPIKAAQDFMLQGKDVDPQANPYLLQRLMRGNPGRADQWIRPAAKGGGTIDFGTYKTNGTSLSDVLAPAKDDLDGLRTYMVAKRAVELGARVDSEGKPVNMEMPFKLEDAQKVANDPDQIAKYDQVAKDFTAYRNRLLQYSVDGGLVDPDVAKGMREDNVSHVPWYRVLPEDEAAATGAGKPYKAIHGSDKTIIDPIESTIRDTYSVIAATEKNNANAQFIKMAKASKAIGEDSWIQKVQPSLKGTTIEEKEMQKFLDSEGIKGRPQEQLTVFRAMRQRLADDQFSVFNKGERETYSIPNDPELLQALKGAPPSAYGPIMKFAAAFTRFKRAGAILNYDFMPVHAVRQQLNAFMNTRTGGDNAIFGKLWPIVSSIQGAADMISAKRGGIDAQEMIQKWRASGGMNAEVTAIDRHYVDKSIGQVEGRNMFGQIDGEKKNPAAVGRFLYNTAENAVDMSHQILAMHDNTLRVREFQGKLQEYIDAGMSEKSAMLGAAYDSREVLLDNFRRGSKLMGLNTIAAFSNLTIQGVDKNFRNFMDNPYGSAARASLVLTASAALWWSHHDDPRYQSAAMWEKNTFWHAFLDNWRPATDDEKKNGDFPEDPRLQRQVNGETQYNYGTTLRIPKPKEYGLLYGSVMERFLDFCQTQDPRTATELGKTILGSLTPNFLPDAAIPVLEQWANKSFFTNGPVVPSGVEGNLPAYQYTEYNTELSKAIGRMLSYLPGQNEIEKGHAAISSPAVIENYVRGWTGGLGMHIMQLADYGLREAGVLNNPVKPESTLSDLPVIHAFVSRYPTASTQDITDFVSNYDRVQEYATTAKFLAEKGDFAASQLMQNSMTEQGMTQLQGIRQGISNANKTLQMLSDSPQYNAQDKRQMMDGIYYQMIEMARQGNAQMQYMTASAHKGHDQASAP